MGNVLLYSRDFSSISAVSFPLQSPSGAFLPINLRTRDMLISSLLSSPLPSIGLHHRLSLHHHWCRPSPSIFLRCFPSIDFKNRERNEKKRKKEKKEIPNTKPAFVLAPYSGAPSLRVIFFPSSGSIFFWFWIKLSKHQGTNSYAITHTKSHVLETKIQSEPTRPSNLSQVFSVSTYICHNSHKIPCV